VIATHSRDGGKVVLIALDDELGRVYDREKLLVYPIEQLALLRRDERWTELPESEGRELAAELLRGYVGGLVHKYYGDVHPWLQGASTAAPETPETA